MVEVFKSSYLIFYIPAIFHVIVIFFLARFLPRFLIRRPSFYWSTRPVRIYVLKSIGWSNASIKFILIFLNILHKLTIQQLILLCYSFTSSHLLELKLQYHIAFHFTIWSSSRISNNLLLKILNLVYIRILFIFYYDNFVFFVILSFDAPGTYFVMDISNYLL